MDEIKMKGENNQAIWQGMVFVLYDSKATEAGLMHCPRNVADHPKVVSADLIANLIG